MQTPNIDCSINIHASVFPSEDPKKIQQSIQNIFSNVDFSLNNDSIKATSSTLESLEKIREVIHSRKSQNSYRRQLNHNLIDDTTWFYLNKQAAFANVVALCSEAEESPMGPIKVIITSRNIEAIIEWLIMQTK